MMKITGIIALTLCAASFLAGQDAAASTAPAPAPAPTDANLDRPIRALMITGGMYHDYNAQSQILTDGISARANVQWTVFHDNGKKDGKVDTSAIDAFFADPDWSKGYDVVVYNDSFQRNVDAKLVAKKLAPHQAGLPAVVLHGSVHTHVDLKTDEWRAFVGIRSPRHGPPQAITVTVLRPDDPIMTGFPAQWATLTRDELYDVAEVFPTSTPLAQAHDVHTGKDYCVAWENLYGSAKTRVFATSLVHADASMKDPAYLTLVTRGLLWSVNSLDAAHLHPAAQVMLNGSKIESTFQDQKGLLYCPGISGIALSGVRLSAESPEERRVSASRSTSCAAGSGRGRELRATST